MGDVQQTTLEGDPLTAETAQTLKIGKIFKHKTPFTCIDFDTSGELCLATAEDELLLYDVMAGSHKKTSFSKKYGCAIAKFTHRKNNILYSSTKGDDAIRYLSFHDNKFIKYFTGHASKVTAIEMCPQDDQFLSASQDGEVRVWDLKSNNCHGILQTQSLNPRIAFDPTGILFAVTTNSNAIRLFDLKSLSAGPFATFSIPPDLGGSPAMNSEWTTVKFSNDGKWLLVGNKQGTACAIDAFEGHVLWQFSGRKCGANAGPLDMDMTISPDGKFVLGGSDDGTINLWEAPAVDENSSKMRVPPVKPLGHLQNSKGDPASALIRFNPRFTMLATASDKNLLYDIVVFK